MSPMSLLNKLWHMWPEQEKWGWMKNWHIWERDRFVTFSSLSPDEPSLQFRRNVFFPKRKELQVRLPGLSRAQNRLPRVLPVSAFSFISLHPSHAPMVLLWPPRPGFPG